MGELTIETVDGKTRFEPGETVEMLVGWNLEVQPEAIEVRAAWKTAGMGTQDMSVVRTERVDHPKAMDGRRLLLELPREPYSFSGKLISLVWFLDVVALPSGEGRHVEITIAPGGREVVLDGASTGGGRA